MSEIIVTNADVEALATKLESMSGDFTEQEQATLQAIFSLAGTGVSAAAGDVEGFALNAYRSANFEVSVRGTQGILIGLNQAFGAGGGGGAGIVGGNTYKVKLLGDGSVYKE